MQASNIQSPNTIFMVRPNHFGFNPQTAASNTFQHGDFKESPETIASKARSEFDAFVETLLESGIDVMVFDEHSPETPDAVFPNNWNSFHPNGKMVLYPMLAHNRRLERRQDIVQALKDRFCVEEVVDLTHYENEGIYLEGTGSIVFDHINKIAYANRSPRTNEKLFRTISANLGYEPLIFNAKDKHGQDIYHTNVMMALGEKLAIICLESLGFYDKKVVSEKLISSGHEIIDIGFEALEHFAGNMIELTNSKSDHLMVMSKSAYESLNDEQATILKKYCRPVYSDLSTIERYAGGSARCMIASIHIPVKIH